MMLRRLHHYLGGCGGGPAMRSLTTTFSLETTKIHSSDISEPVVEKKQTETVPEDSPELAEKKEAVLTEIKHLKYIFPYLMPWTHEMSTAKLEKLPELTEEVRSKFFLNIAASERMTQLIKARRAREIEEHGIKEFNPNTIFIWTRKATINTFQKNNIAHAMKFNTPTVLDCSYQKNAEKLEKWKFEQTLIKVMDRHLGCSSPLNLHFTGIPQDSNLSKFIDADSRIVQPAMIRQHSEHYLDLFDKSRLIYLTSYARYTLPKQFDYDKIFIIGGLQSLTEPLSLIRAKKEGLAAYSLPVQQAQLRLRGGTKFHVEVVVRIVAEAARTGCWFTALQNVTRKFVLSPEELLDVKKKTEIGYWERKSRAQQEGSMLRDAGGSRHNSQSKSRFSQRHDPVDQTKPKRHGSHVDDGTNFSEQAAVKSMRQANKPSLIKRSNTDWLNSAGSELFSNPRREGPRRPSLENQPLHSKPVGSGRKSANSKQDHSSDKNISWLKDEPWLK